MTGGARVIGADRGQPCSDLVDLDSQLPAEHRARVVRGVRRDAGLAGVLRGHQSRAVALMHAIAHNLWRAQGSRAAAA